MALASCKECGKEVSTSATKCPHCGISNPGRKFSISFWQLAVSLIIIFYLLGKSGEKTSGSNVVYPVSAASYETINADVGCKSTYSDTKKNDIFNSKYNNHWMMWSGKIVLADSDSISIDVDETGLQDLSVQLAESKSGYDLRKGQYVTVKFLMKSNGGCFLPFGGEKGTIVP